MSPRAYAYICVTTAASLALLSEAFTHWHPENITRFLTYFLIAALSSGLKVRLPGIYGTLSVNFLFILLAVVELSLPETLAMACISALLQSCWKSRSGRRPAKMFFNVSNMVIAAAASFAVYHQLTWPAFGFGFPLKVIAMACTYFITNTFPVAVIVWITERKPLIGTWKACYFWSFPYYLVGAAIASQLSIVNRTVGWQDSVLVLPAVYWIYRSYRSYLDRLEKEKKHVEEMAGLHLRTIEALALAIEAKDQTTHSHLCRVQVYAVEVGRDMNLSEPELEALRAAAMLHDIGKLAVPEHIISKPGKLTPEEFEKMKIHPIVGAEILERVKFPYPVVPIVASHHERWDGAGYPKGLKNEEIPIGARILSAVDCLDALASDRQYRRALPLDKAMEIVAGESGSAYDPAVVEVLRRRYTELEQMAREAQTDGVKLSTDVKVEKGAAPAAGFENSEGAPTAQPADAALEFLSTIGAARNEGQVLFDLAQQLGNSLRLDETLSLFAARLQAVIPYDSIAVYTLSERILSPVYVNGADFRLFSSLAIPVGQGLSGWVAENKKAIVNGNPSVESSYLSDPLKVSSLFSALCVPLETAKGVMGVLTLYHTAQDAYSRDHLRVLQAIRGKLAQAIENGLKYKHDAGTDCVTELPNARSLFLHLNDEVARCSESGEGVTVVVCDLDGFKAVNDRFGHLEGNRLLRVLATYLKQSCREQDYVARLGGDEFVLVLPGVAAEPELVDRFRELAVQAGCEVCGEDVVSMSTGLACYPHDGSRAEQLLATADSRMYECKEKRKQRRIPVAVTG
jgi:diguanylate cyclase (GGDEF)-like protein/putative nucleotidyltransferase with HDIG domain